MFNKHDIQFLIFICSHVPNGLQGMSEEKYCQLCCKSLWNAADQCLEDLQTCNNQKMRFSSNLTAMLAYTILGCFDRGRCVF